MDVDEFFDDDLEAKTALYTRAGQSKYISVYFDREFTPTSLGELAVQMTTPKATCKSADVVGVDQSTTLTIDGVLFKVMEIHPDAIGFTELILTRD